MALADLLNEYSSRKSEFCPFGQLLNKLTNDDKVALAKALDRKVPVNAIIQALKSDGHKISKDSFDNHRKEICRCPRA